MTRYLETGEFTARLERIYYDASLESQPDRPYPFVYHVRLENCGDRPLQVQGRKWVVAGDSGRKMIIEGEGVVGQKPVIEPGGHFRYHSYLTLGENSVIFCCYFAHDDQGSPLCARLPEIRIILPPGTVADDQGLL